MGLGSWVVVSGPSTQIVNDEKIYHSTNFCNTTDFFITTTENNTYCIFLSNRTADYITARNDCKARGAYLFTPKNAEKFQVMKGILDPPKTETWFGLNDILTEGDLRWEDDETKIDEAWKEEIFSPGEPSDSYYQEDCVSYTYPDYINDSPCWFTKHYVCEVDFN
ncbi:collectin-11-like [Physella acuta]|uniref:collectin-11-like n=1 Tax=Physella acuta TaxID=109671 RepID=UPI0027DDDE4F|nr:collectin-11-like [Physella acuta]